jgi:hypothetical protein
MRKYNWIWGFSLCMIIIGLGFWGTHVHDITLKKNHVVVCATILSVNIEKQYYVDYEFVFNGKSIKEQASCLKVTKDNYDDGLRKILVVVSKENPHVNNLLENQDDFIKYNIIPADTVGVLCSYISN